MTTTVQVSLQDRWPISQDAITAFCQRHHIAKLSLFGSILRDDFTPESDIDVLVEFELGKTPGLAIITMQQELSAICNGRTIDLRTPQELSRYFRDRVLTEALVQYVKGKDSGSGGHRNK